MPDSDAQSRETQQGVRGSGPRSPLGVAVVDDDPTIRRLLARFFEDDGRFRLVATARDGHEAVEVVGSRRPDLVVLDVSMPVMDGITAAAKIRAEYPGTQIAMCSSDRHRREEAVRAGADLWVDKPIDFRSLSRVLLAAATATWPSSRPDVQGR